MFSLNRWIKLSGIKVFLPFYHMVSDEPQPHVQHLYPFPTELRFKQDLIYLLRHFKAISYEELKHAIDSKSGFSEPVMHLSFDDGFRQCHEVVAPILKGLGVPATFFVNPAFIGNADLMYRCKASWIISNHPEQAAKLLNIKYASRDELDRIINNGPLELKEYLESQRPYLQDSDVRTLIADGFTIGNHSYSHADFAFLNTDEQIAEVLNGKRALAERFEIKDPPFAFPFTDAFTTLEFWDKAKTDNGFGLSFGTAGVKKDEVPNHFQRTSLETSSLSIGRLVKGEFQRSTAKRMLGNQMVKH